MEWLNVLEINDIIHKLKATYIVKEHAKSENELMSHLWSNENIMTLVYGWLESRYENKESKSIAKAQKFKAMGNKEFQAKNFTESIQFYTKCLQHAPANSNELPIAIANRSASLFYLNRYDDCIKDIELAIKLNYPKELHYKLYLRAVQCYLKLGKQHLAEKMLSKIHEIIHDPDYIAPSMRGSIEKKISEVSLTKPCTQNVAQSVTDLLKLKSQIGFKENINFPHASITINKKCNKELGRYVVANEFIKKGDILFLEKPAAFVLLNHDSLNELCQNCNCSNRDIPISCPTCLNTFYCNEKCLTEAWPSYHCWECPGSQMKLWEGIGMGHLALKVLLTCATTTDITKFNEIQNLITNFDKLPMDDLTTYGIVSIMLTIYLLEYTNFFKINNLKECLVNKFLDNSFNSSFNILTDNDKQLYVSSLLLRYILQLIGNGHAISTSSTLIKYMKEDCQNIVATGIYPSASMTNHSCDPNATQLFVDQYLIVKASRDIAKHEEIFNCYGQWVDCIICLENTLPAITKRFGSSSRDLLYQLNDLIDVSFIYLEKEPNTTTDTYKNRLKRTEKYLKQIEEMVNLHFGSWSRAYKDVKIKQEKLVNFE
ncbi:SET and MYND domain-containing protein 4 [Habropoda laboriosa]|uniref:Protein-lysine N-methyltransferase SMYD4 n=1 Tax=Habropoda laboriosa TaxID=597456 RepID=A0A0L7R9P0_9HYME|nr:SET and MYND domain-containing protein 4 [Habropoda laboriosa]